MVENAMPWFRAERLGWGSGPARGQGWLVTAGVALAMIGVPRLAD